MDPTHQQSMEVKTNLMILDAQNFFNCTQLPQNFYFLVTYKLHTLENLFEGGFRGKKIYNFEFLMILKLGGLND
jgi:hypothetical protein